MRQIQYDREKAVGYAKKWAYSRNPAYYNYDPVGGDCTNFVSQCIFQGIGIMNEQKTNGWYYHSGNDKSPSWTGVEYLAQFLINNRSAGPYAKICEVIELEKGDLAQLSFDGKQFGHSLLIVDKKGDSLADFLVATHTFDSYGRRLNSYSFEKIRFLHILGGKKW